MTGGGTRILFAGRSLIDTAISNRHRLIEQERMKEYKLVVILAGGNDLSEIERTTDGLEESERRTRGVETVEEIVQVGRRLTRMVQWEGAKAVWMTLPPRKDVTEGLRREANRQIQKAAKEEGAKLFDPQMASSVKEFLQETYDGIHFGKEQWRLILKCLLRELGRDD